MNINVEILRNIRREMHHKKIPLIQDEDNNYLWFKYIRGEKIIKKAFGGQTV